MPHKFINLWQTPEERQQKYHLARSLGMNSAWAERLRDWRLNKIERLFNLQYAFTPYAQFYLFSPDAFKDHNMPD